jgi:hypothetical protein
MWIKRGLVAAAACMLALGSGSVALAASGGDPNAGDVWTDNVGQPPGPGHEQDPHLACTDINLWGAGLADSGGSFTIDGWPPSGSQEVDYSSSWSYNPATGGDQVVAVISISQLISTARANGDAPKNKNGYHFKLDFSQDPQKHKTFWVNCPPGSPAAPAGAPSTSAGAPRPSGQTPTTTSSRGTESAGQTFTSSQTRPGHHKKHKKLVKPKRHRSVRARRVQQVSAATPAFTG